MRHLLLLVGLLGSIFFTTANAQFRKGNASSSLKVENGMVYGFITGEVIEGSAIYNGKATKPQIMIQASVQNGANVFIGGVPFKLSSDESKNRGVINVIGSSSNDRLGFAVELTSDNLIIISPNGKNKNADADLFKTMDDNQKIWVKLGDNVYKFDLSNLGPLVGALRKALQGNNNPFAGNSDNPFQG